MTLNGSCTAFHLILHFPHCYKDVNVSKSHAPETLQMPARKERLQGGKTFSEAHVKAHMGEWSATIACLHSSLEGSLNLFNSIVKCLILNLIN